MLCNAAQADADDDALRVARRILGLPDEESAPSPAVAIAATELQRLAGPYRDSTNEQMVGVSVRDGALLVVGAGGGLARMTHLGNHRFWASEVGEIRFEPAGSGWRMVQFAGGWRRFERVARPDPSSIRYSDYAGRYRSPELDVVFDIVEASDKLVLHRPHDPPVPLAPVFRDGFAGMGVTLRFERDGDGGIRGIRLFAGRVRNLELERMP